MTARRLSRIGAFTVACMALVLAYVLVKGHIG
jgi:hypothetical protein